MLPACSMQHARSTQHGSCLAGPSSQKLHVSPVGVPSRLLDRARHRGAPSCCLACAFDRYDGPRCHRLPGGRRLAQLSSRGRCTHAQPGRLSGLPARCCCCGYHAGRYQQPGCPIRLSTAAMCRAQCESAAVTRPCCMMSLTTVMRRQPSRSPLRRWTLSCSGTRQSAKCW